MEFIPSSEHHEHPLNSNSTATSKESIQQRLGTSEEGLSTDLPFVQSSIALSDTKPSAIRSTSHRADHSGIK
jgi:hypothetical protein